MDCVRQQLFTSAASAGDQYADIALRHAITEFRQLREARQRHRQRRAVVAAAVVGNEGRDVVRRGQQVGGADNGGQWRKQIGHEVVSGSALVSESQPAPMAR